MQVRLTERKIITLSLSDRAAPTPGTHTDTVRQLWQYVFPVNGDFWHALTHAIFILVAIGAIQFSKTKLTSILPELPSLQRENQAQGVYVQRARPLFLPTELAGGDDELLAQVAVPHTIIPNRSRVEISNYTVQPGDTIFGIAAAYGLDPETVMWANATIEQNPDLLSVGQELTILPVDGVYYQVGGKDTLDSIAGSFKVTAADIIGFKLNELDPDNPVIKRGQWLIIPGGVKPYVPKQVQAYAGPIPEGAQKGSGNFSWPTSGSISQSYWAHHRAIDIAGATGSPIYAADSGFVIEAGTSDVGYGRMILIDHGNGYQTLYAHMNKLLVKVGDSVPKGQLIGEMGRTGNATGPHLHFEVRENGNLRNPFNYLK
jgi:murein DD-endopeptidase MepM/ murein hydrolase activator NlpD